MHTRITLLLSAFLLCVSPLRVHALQIILTYTNGLGNAPMVDPQGTLLMSVAQAAADHWEDIIEDTHTLNITVQYNNGIAANLIGLWNGTVTNNGRIIGGVINIRANTNWYYDLTPNDHSEYVMVEGLYRDTNPQNAANFTGSVPGVLEITYTGNAAPGSTPSVQLNRDLLSTLIHEIGHGLGMTTALADCATEVADNDYDVNPALANGNVFAIGFGTGTGAHTTCQMCLMNGTGRPVGVRRLPCAADVLALATCPNPAWTNIDFSRREFYPGGTTDWTTAANWVGGKVPSSNDDASCRFGADVVGDVLLTMSGNGFCRDLLMSGATRIRTFSNKLDATRNVVIEYDGNLPIPEIFVESGGELEAVDVTVNGGDLDLSGGLVDLSDDLILSADTLGKQGNLSGYGTVDVLGTLRNDGRITAENGNTLTFISASATPWDLDGATGVGEVFATTGHLNFSTGAVADDFDGLLQITAPYSVSFGQGWTLGPGGEINLTGGNPQEALLAGAALNANDGIIRAALRARITAPVTFGASVETLIFPDSSLRLDGAATFFTGGAHLIGANSPVSFYGGATILGGTFGLNGGSQLEVRSTVFLNGGAFSGSGELKVFAPGRLQLALGASVGVGVVNQGGIVEMGPAISHATVESFSQNIFGTLEVGISGTPGSGSYDVLTVSDTASLAGTLKVAFNVPGASPGDTWQILAADTIVNGFNSIQVTGVPAGQKLIAHQTDTGLYLKLTADLTYAGWASAKGLIPPNDDLAKDGDGDGVANAFEAILGGGPSSNDSDLLSAPFLLNVSGTNYLAIALPLAPATTINDLNILAVRSDDLQTWNTSNVVLHSTTFDAMVCIETRVYRSTVPASSQTNEFLRFDVQLIPP